MSGRFKDVRHTTALVVNAQHELVSFFVQIGYL